MRGVFIGRRFDDTVFVLAVGLVLLMLAAGVGFTLLYEITPPLPLVVGWGVLVLVAAARGGWIAADRRRMVASVDGVLVGTGRRTNFIPNDQVTAVALHRRSQFFWGEAQFQIVAGELTVGSGRRAVRVPFAYRHPLTGHDPLRWWWGQLLEQLEQRAVAELDAGGELMGDHWRLTRDGLTWRRKHLPAKQITAADEADGAVCVWRAGDERPAFRLPAGSPNALVLWGVLTRALGVTADDRPANSGLGRLLVERRLGGGWLMSVMMYFVCLGVAAGGVYVATTMPDWTARAVGWLIAAVGVGFGVFVWVSAGRVLSLHSAGVRMTGRFGPRRILFADLCEMIWLPTRNHYNAVYIGTTLRARLRAYDGTAIGFQISVTDGDIGLEELRQAAVGHVADRLRAHLARGRRVPWVGRLSFTPDGLAVAPWLPWFGGREQILPYWSLDWELDGELKLRSGGQRVSVAVNIGEVNFQPGLVLLDHLRANPQPELVALRRA